MVNEALAREPTAANISWEGNHKIPKSYIGMKGGSGSTFQNEHSIHTTDETPYLIKVSGHCPLVNGIYKLQCQSLYDCPVWHKSGPSNDPKLELLGLASAIVCLLISLAPWGLGRLVPWLIGLLALVLWPYLIAAKFWILWSA
jgi:hypothetical protein